MLDVTDFFLLLLLLLLWVRLRFALHVESSEIEFDCIQENSKSLEIWL